MFSWMFIGGWSARQFWVFKSRHLTIQFQQQAVIDDEQVILRQSTTRETNVRETSHFVNYIAYEIIWLCLNKNNTPQFNIYLDDEPIAVNQK